MSRIDLGSPPSDKLGITINLENRKLEISRPEERCLVTIKNVDGEIVNELEYPHRFWHKQRKKSQLKKQIEKHTDLEINEEELNKICLTISKNVSHINGPSKDEEKIGEKEEEEEVIKQKSKVETDDTLYEQILTPKGPKYVYLNDGSVKKTPSLKLGDVKYVPRNDEAVKKNSVLLPTSTKEYGSTKQLVEKIRKLIHKYVDVSKRYEKLAAWYVITTWVYDELSTLSYLRALGDTGTGKSRFEDVVGRLCYKPIIVSGAVTPAPIYRLMEQWKGTLIIDEGDLKKSDARNEVVTILNCGFERGRPVIRCTKDDPDDIQFHRTFGPKIIATRQEFNDKALESRCLTEKMSETTREDLPDQLPEEFFKKAEEMRNKLLKWRLDNKKNVDVARSRKIKMGNIEPRLKQATRSFLAVFEDEEIQEELFNFLEKHQKELVKQRARTWEGIVINILHDYWKEGKEKLDGEEDIWSKKISDAMKDEYSIKKASPQWVGRTLSSFEIETERKRVLIKDGEGGENRKQKRCVVWDEDKMDHLFKRYVVDYADFVTKRDTIDKCDNTYGLKGVFRGISKSREIGGKHSASEGPHSPHALSQSSLLSNDVTESEVEEVKRELESDLAYTSETLSDELDMGLDKVKEILEALYEEKDVEKKPNKEKDSVFYRKIEGGGFDG